MARGFLQRAVPKPFHPALESAWIRLREPFHKYRTKRLFGRNARLVPPLRMMHDGPVGYKDFMENGLEFFRHYVDLCGLRPDERMLDVGSGIGRKTLPLVSYLSSNGRYEGMDIVKSGIDWCVEKYTRDYPNFRFQLIDVFNQHYNPGGTNRASEYEFPFPDEHFDFAVLNSVFTHMMPDEVANYLSEVDRVLRPGGRCFVSLFLLNEESRCLIEAGQSTLDLRHEFGPAKAVSLECPEQAIGYDEDYVVRLFARGGLEMRRPIFYGSWCSRQKFVSYQDLILAFKKAS